MKSKKLKTTIRPIDEKIIIIKGASKITAGAYGKYNEQYYNTTWQD